VRLTGGSAYKDGNIEVSPLGVLCCTTSDSYSVSNPSIRHITCPSCTVKVLLQMNLHLLEWKTSIFPSLYVEPPVNLTLTPTNKNVH
jgi:hypothetical protein